jgi:tRNA nucleotidyltransferase (CCA-adding enzyme)
MEIITTHLHADFDSLASMVAAQKLYPNAIPVFPGSQEKNVRDFFDQSVQVFHFQRLKNIPLKEVSKLIIVDTKQKKRIGKFSQCLTNSGIEIHIYDHHPPSPDDIEGDHSVIMEVGSTTTILTQILREKKIAITAEDATLMAMAIHEDTGSFTFDTTTADDMEAAAWLIRQGAEVGAVSQYISQELNAHELGILHKMIDSAKTYTIRGIDIVVAKTTVPEYVDEYALLVRKFMVIENLNVIFALANMADRIYLIARSRVPEVNVGQIALEFGGGGHASAASSTIKDMTMIQAEEKLIRQLHKYVRPENLAADLMSSPIISVTPEITINEANKVLTRYSITVLPVLEDNAKVVGIISRRVTEKAIFHGLGHLAVSDYMSTDFAVLPPTATLADIQEVIIENRQRFIPVVDSDAIIGVITRTDLLNILIKDPAHTPKSKDTDSQPSIERNRNLTNLLTTSLSVDMMILLQTIGETARDNNYSAFAVGGFVRDLIRHKPNLDLDIVIEGDGVDFAKKLAKQLKGQVRAHEKFNTAVVKLPEGFKIDIATARLEYYEYPAAMPTVELSSIKLDLFRRDFTINALAIHLNPDRFGTLVDFFNCQNDIRDRQIRVLHNLSFVEDPTRIFRAIRLEQRLGFQLGKLTEKLIKNAVRMNMFNRFSGRRFFNELHIILSEENPIPAIYRMDRFQLLSFLHPSLKLDQRLKNILTETHRSLAWYRLLYLDEPCQQWLVFLLSLLTKLSAKQTLTFCQKFEVPDRQVQFLMKEKTACGKIVRILSHRLIDTDYLSEEHLPAKKLQRAKGPRHQGPPMRPSEIYWLLQDLSPEGLLHLMSITTGTSGKKAVSLYVTKLRHIETLIKGNDLKKMGYRPSPLFSTILNHLLEARLDGHIATRKEERSFVKDNYPL